MSRNRRKKSGASPPRAIAATPTTPRVEPAPKYVLHKSGLRYLFDKGQINRRQFEAGERYGRDHRDAEMGDACTIQSSLAALETGGCGGNGGRPIAPAGGIDVLMQERILIARVERDAVHALFFYDADAVAVLSAICGRQMTPTESARSGFDDTDSMARERAKEILAVLRSLLTLLAAHYRKRDEPETARGAA